jgi:flagellar hook protein FlgE
MTNEERQEFWNAIESGDNPLLYFQANSKTITTSDQMLQTLLELKR